MCERKKIKRNQFREIPLDQCREIRETYMQDDEYTFDCLTERESGVEEASFRAWQIAEYEE